MRFVAALKLPMLIGMFASNSCEIELSDAVVAVSIVDAFATTSTVSARPPTFSANGTLTVRPMPTSRLRSVRGVKPDSSAFTSYGPGLRPTKRNSPFSSLTVTCDPMRPVRVSVTPGSTPPCSSVTFPAMVPVRD